MLDRSVNMLDFQGWGKETSRDVAYVQRRLESSKLPRRSISSQANHCAVAKL